MTTTNATQLTLELPKYYNTFRSIHGLLIRFTLPYIFIVACIGLVTNASTTVLLSKSFVTKNLRQKWTLMALAISDLLLNMALLIRVIHDLTGGKMEQLCLVISFLSNLAELLSAGYTVLFTVQRYSAVRYPLQTIVQKRSSPIVALLLIFLSSLLFCVVLTLKNLYIDCHEELSLNWFIADALSSFIIPFLLILIFNILIVNLIRKHARSAITVQSTLLRPDKRGKSDAHQARNRNAARHESYSITYTCGNSNSILGTLSIEEFQRNCKPIDFLTKADEHAATITRTRGTTSSHNSDDPDFPANESFIPMTTLEKHNFDLVRNNHSASSSHQSLNDEKKQKMRTSSVKSRPRGSSHRSTDEVSFSNKDNQTTQSIRVTRMLVLVSTCFLILNAPAHIFVILLKLHTEINANVYEDHHVLNHFKQTKNLTNNQWKNLVFIQTSNHTLSEGTHVLSHEMAPNDDPILIHILYIAVSLTQLISYASYSINFFLYSYSGVTFRTSLRQFFNKLYRH